MEVQSSTLFPAAQLHTQGRECNPPLGTPVLLTNERAYNLGAANNFHISAFYLVLHFRSSIPPEWRRGFTRSSVTLLYLVSVVWLSVLRYHRLRRTSRISMTYVSGFEPLIGLYFNMMTVGAAIVQRLKGTLFR